MVNSVVEWFTGKDIGDHIYAFFFNKTESTTNDAGIAGETGNTKSTDARQKSKK